MSDARRGYTHAMAQLVASMDQTSTVAQFASYCISHEVPVEEVAKAFKVTRATVYNWFKGVYSPRERQLAKMQSILSRASKAGA
jgi:DNA invertase Pin-like site-specific DNA recombinase